LRFANGIFLMPSERTVIEPRNAHLNVSRNKKLPHSPGIRVGNLVFLSGMVSVDPTTGETRTGTLAEETRTVLENMQHMLESAGTCLANSVKVTLNISEMADYAEMNRVYREFFNDVNPPACSVNAVQLSFGLKIEIECVAFIAADSKVTA
jgi:2-iminobutanoate/2-iminopropanoate deaminase